MKEPILAVKIIVFGLIIVILSSFANSNFLKSSSVVMVDVVIKVMVFDNLAIRQMEFEVTKNGKKLFFDIRFEPVIYCRSFLLEI